MWKNEKRGKEMKNYRLGYRISGLLCAAVLALTACGHDAAVDEGGAQDAQPAAEAGVDAQNAVQKEEGKPDQTDGTQPSAEEKGAVQETQESGSEQKAEEKESEPVNIALEGEGLAGLYADNFPIGVALPNQVLNNMDEYEEVILHNFNSITCENEMKPEALLDRTACRADLAACYENPAVRFDSCAPAIEFALKNNIKIRLHTLVWHSQTPDWFFTEDYTDDGELVSREVMLKRMENYIASVLGYFEENYPGLIYAVDVVNEAFDTGDGDENGVRMKKNRWYDTVGDDYYYQAFVFARKYAADDMKLFYNDYACMWKTDLILEHLAKAKEEGLIDGIGMQSHLSTDDNIRSKFIIAAKQFCDAGYEVQITELDIGIKDSTDISLMRQARKYKAMFSSLKSLQEEGYPITGITVWGLNDRLTWRTGEHPLLFDETMLPKKAYEGAMLMDSIVDIE